MRIAEEKLRRAAEARLKASQGQEPVAEVCPSTDESGIIGVAWGGFNVGKLKFGDKLYAQPPIQPELAELQRENAELTRKLAEQQAFILECQRSDGLLRNGFNLSESATDVLHGHATELRKLLEGSKVPEGWQLVPKMPSIEMIQDGCSKLDSQFDEVTGRKEVKRVYKAMLAAAPQPKEPEVRVKLCDSCGFHQNCPTRNDDGGLCDDYIPQPKEPKQ